MKQDLQDWQPGLPKEEGTYWLHGMIPDISTEEETALLEVHKISNGFMYVCQGTSIWENNMKESEPLFFISYHLCYLHKLILI